MSPPPARDVAAGALSENATEHEVALAVRAIEADRRLRAHPVAELPGVLGEAEVRAIEARWDVVAIPPRAAADVARSDVSAPLASHAALSQQVAEAVSLLTAALRSPHWMSTVDIDALTAALAALAREPAESQEPRGAETMCAPCSHRDHGKCRDERGMGSGIRGARCACGLCWPSTWKPSPEPTPDVLDKLEAWVTARPRPVLYEPAYGAIVNWIAAERARRGGP